MDGRGPRRAMHFLVAHLAPHAIGDVFPDGAREQERFLLHNADLLAQIAARIFAQLHAVDGDAALILVEPRQQIHQRGLAGAGGADEGHGLARLKAEADAVEHRQVLGIGEAHVVEDDLAAQVAVGPVGALVQRLAIFADDVGHAVERDQRHRHLHDEAADVSDGPHDPGQHTHVGQEGADGDRPVDGHDRPDGIADDELYLDDDVGRRPVEGVEKE